jgi:DNA-binding response OmpR family regulator
MPGKKKILIVEDDQFLHKILVMKVKAEGIEPISAYDGESALKKVKEMPDLILLDLILPQMSGFEFLGEIRMDSSQFKNIPVIVLSNLGQDEDIERAKSLGAQDYLIKANFSIDEVIKKAKEWLVRKK